MIGWPEMVKRDSTWVSILHQTRFDLLLPTTLTTTTTLLAMSSSSKFTTSWDRAPGVPARPSPVPAEGTVYIVPQLFNATITRPVTGTFSRPRVRHSVLDTYPSIASIVDRAEKNAQIVIPKDKKGRSDTMADLWMVDLVHAHAITAANILNRVEGANGPLEELIRRGLFDKDGDEYGDNQLKRSYRFAGAIGAQLLDHMIGLDNRVSCNGDSDVESN